MTGFALAGAGQTAPAMNNAVPDFVVKGDTNLSYLIFGGTYTSANWTSWRTQTYYLEFSYATEADGLWLGFAVAAAGDVTGDGATHRDVLIGDLRYLYICDPEDAMGKAWLVHDVVYTQLRPPITLSAGAGAVCDLTEITSYQAGNWFGSSMGWAGNMDEDETPLDDFIIGACLWDDTTNTKVDVGRTYIFLGDDSMDTSLNTSDDGTAFTGENQYDHFGCAVVGLDGLNSGDDAIAVGASWYDKSSNGSIVENNCGRVYIFYSNGSLSPRSAASDDITITGADDDNFFGCALASGDFIGDVTGHDDLAVGAYGYDGYKGRVYIFSAATLVNSGGALDAGDANVILTGSAALDLFGSSVANAGDFFAGSARDALIVGAPGASTLSDALAGKAFVYNMNDNQLQITVPDYIIEGNAAGAAYGKAVTGLGQVDDDSDIDVAVGGGSKVEIHDAIK
jgi:hypothetical protein